ncbi:hypothetical protein EJ08DRAFT_309478 [Tothia fuscella]|uniref:Uncharacterized protein n=1 Tax=Tothia fuscella TaxID=1048955 RepID=A0A9P4TXM5_9PEZI|nr:hypothetical protein EJ08DRAFT_309478 [Tothia fuscella]
MNSFLGPAKHMPLDVFKPVLEKSLLAEGVVGFLPKALVQGNWYPEVMNLVYANPLYDSFDTITQAKEAGLFLNANTGDLSPVFRVELILGKLNGDDEGTRPLRRAIVQAVAVLDDLPSGRFDVAKTDGIFIPALVKNLVAMYPLPELAKAYQVQAPSTSGEIPVPNPRGLSYEEGCDHFASMDPRIEWSDCGMDSIRNALCIAVALDDADLVTEICTLHPSEAHTLYNLFGSPVSLAIRQNCHAALRVLLELRVFGQILGIEHHCCHRYCPSAPSDGEKRDYRHGHVEEPEDPAYGYEDDDDDNEYEGEDEDPDPNGDPRGIYYTDSLALVEAVLLDNTEAVDLILSNSDLREHLPLYVGVKSDSREQLEAYDAAQLSFF